MLRRSAAVLVLCLGLFGLAAEASPVRDSSITGWFEVVWADPRRGTEGPPEAVFVITDYGESVRLDVEEATLQSAGGILKLNHQRVTIDGAFSGTPSTRRTYRAERIRRTRALNPNPAADAVTGAQPWVSIACKFSDVVTEPNNLTYFQNMYANASPGLDHYWRQQSYDLVNVAGSLAAGWFTLPQPRSYYVYDQNSDGEPDADLNRLVTDCVNVADPTVNFANFVGINMMFNDLLDCCAWGGGWYMNKDGVEKSWRVTWDPPWAYQDIAVIGHEMGHGFGLPHSSGQYGYTYDNQWDVMSDTWSNCSNLDDPTYGCLGQHTISHHKNYLEWIAVGQRYTHPSGTSATITLEQLALPATGNYRMAVIPINGSSSHFYTVEVRRKVGYDVKLPGEGVIIHEVLTSRSRPANVVDPDGNFNTGDAGAIWTAGETFTDGANGVQVTVNSATATGYSVTINTGVVTTVDLTSSANPSSAGQEVTFTATVNGGTPGSATGTVTFKSDGDELATIALVNAQATYSTSSLPLGGHFITAHYSGSLTHPAAVSPSLFQKVYPLVSINDVAVNEGNAGTTNATFNVTLSQASELPVSVDFSTSNVTAVGGQTFVNSNQVAIPLGGTATPYPSTINVSGVSGNITKLTVQLSGYRHTWPGDVDVLLVGPGGQSLVLLSDAGLNNDVYLVNLTFDDSAATSLTSAPVTSGIYKPSNFDDAEGLDSYPSPAPVSGYGSTLSVFNGTNPNGTWSLYVVDDVQGDGGAFEGGWSLAITTPGADYTTTQGTLTFNSGVTLQTITVPILGDTSVEANETFNVNLTSTDYAILADNIGIGTITDDDGATPPTNVVATATSATSVLVNWTPVGSATSYKVLRSANGLTYILVGSPSAPPFTDTSASPNTAYLYKVHAMVGAAESSDSNRDLATTVAFTDPTLTANSTRVKLAHFTELLTAVNAVRTLASLGGISFTAPTPTALVTVRRQHLLDLRTGLDAARTMLALPSLTYTDGTITAGVTKVKGAHVTDLRGGTQ